jgi:formylglycine-generating enzyme required for sulfatase activity
MKRITAFAICCIALLACGPGDAAPGNTYTNSIGMEFVLIPAGSFVSEDEEGGPNGPRMIVSKPFYLGKYEVTQEQWVAVMGNNPAKFKGPDNPVESVSWNDAREFIERLNAREGRNLYRLPTEAEWELAARGGTDTKLFFMEDPKIWEEAESPLADYAWFNKNSSDTTHPVGQKKPNQYGLYDIYGNVWEWVEDWHGKLPEARELGDYQAPSGEDRVNRGGGWGNEAEDCRSGYRGFDGPDYRDDGFGFRLAFSAE